jgi:diacylglycerol kinase (ATP)
MSDINNKPKYTIFKNASYAIDGLKHAFKTETSFKIELFLGIPIFLAIIMIDTTVTNKLILVVTALLVPIVELLNSAVENVVDLVTKEFHPLAKSAKDIGATAVLFSVILHITCWVVILLNLGVK